MLKEKLIIPVDFNTARNKAETYCAYQERSQQEVREKLYKMGVKTIDCEQIISYLIENNFLNEVRFAQAYVSGKFRIKNWGKNKIKQGLKLKNIPEGIIKKALAGINQDDYLAVLEKLMQKKHQELGYKTDIKTKSKIVNYALSKGFESNFIFLLLNNKELKK